MYPEVCALLPGLKDDVLESYKEHRVADVLCMELAGMSADAERFDAKATVLIENVTHQHWPGCAPSDPWSVALTARLRCLLSALAKGNGPGAGPSPVRHRRMA